MAGRRLETGRDQVKRIRWLASGLGIIVILGGLNAAADPPPNDGHGISGRGDPGSVVVGGQQAKSGSRPDVRLPDPVGTLRLVACGNRTEVELQALRDLNAVGDAGGCKMWVPGCLASQNSGRQFTGASVRIMKQADGTWSLNGSQCTLPAKSVVTAELVRQQAVRLVPSAAVGLAPHGTTLVNIETVMWADAPRRQVLRPVTLLGRRVVISLVLDHVAWVFGDGQSEADAPAGRAYDSEHDPCRAKTCPQYYGHIYVQTGRVTVRATASWRALFTVDGGAGVDIPGTVDGPQAQAPLAVKQARGVLVPNPGGH